MYNINNNLFAYIAHFPWQDDQMRITIITKAQYVCIIKLKGL